jgi:hypothetical protein
MKMTPGEIKSALAQCIGTTEYYAHWTGGGKLVYTDGVRAMAEMCGAYWLIDEIMIAQRNRAVRAYARQDELQVWRLTHAADHAETGHWLLSMDDGNDNLIFSKEIEFSDFPLEEGIKLYFQWSGRGVLFLASEY